MARRSRMGLAVLVAASVALILAFLTPAPTSAAPARIGNGSGLTGRAAEGVQTIACGQEREFSDENGRWQLRFQCFAEYGVINWHYNLSPKAQAIATSWVTEDGLRWWRDGVEQPKNAPHFVPVDYTLHGTLSRVFVGNVLDYQDYLTFRHNLGGGGTAAVTFAGSIRLVY